MDALTIPRWRPSITRAQVDALPATAREEARVRVEAMAAGHRQRCVRLAELFNSNQPQRQEAESDEAYQARLRAYEAWQRAVYRGDDRRTQHALLARAHPER